MAIEQFANFPQSTIANVGGIGSSDGTLTVASAAAFPTSGNFRILVDNELMLVTAVSGNVFTLTRPIENTSAAGHANGATVTAILTAGGLQQFRADTNATGAYSSRPAAGRAGRWYIPNDQARVWSLDNGTSWQPYGPMFAVTDPSAASFSWVNQGSATVTTQYGGIYLTVPPGSGSNSLNIYETTITGSSQVTMLLAINGGGAANVWNAGVSIRCPAQGPQVATYVFGGGATGFGSFIYNTWTNPTTFGSTVGSIAYTAGNIWPGCSYIWFRRRVVGATAFLAFSGDGINFGDIFGTSTSNGLGGAATTIGIYADNVNSGNNNVGVHLLHLSQS